MYVDPQIKKFVEELASQEAPHPVEMGLEAAREGFSQLWRMVNPENRELERNEDLFIPGPSGDIRCKLYVPKGTTGPLPIQSFLMMLNVLLLFLTIALRRKILSLPHWKIATLLCAGYKRMQTA